MSNLTLNARLVLNDIKGIMYSMIQVDLTVTDGFIPIMSGVEYVKITDNTTDVYAFGIVYSANQKTWAAFFTTNAFSGLGSTVNVELGYNGAPYETIENTSFTVAPLAPIFLGISHIPADNNWLTNL